MGGMEALAEGWLEKNVTVDSHFSGNWLDVKPREWASGTHEKSSDEERTWRKDGRGGQACERCYSIHVSQKMCRILDDQKESSHIVKPSGFYVCFYVSFYFHQAFVSPRKGQIFTPVKGTQSLAQGHKVFIELLEKQFDLLPPTLQRSFSFAMENCFLLWKIRDCFAESQREIDSTLNGLRNRPTRAAGSRVLHSAWHCKLPNSRLSATLPSI